MRRYVTIQDARLGLFKYICTFGIVLVGILKPTPDACGGDNCAWSMLA